MKFNNKSRFFIKKDILKLSLFFLLIYLGVQYVFFDKSKPLTSNFFENSTNNGKPT